ncbi:MAG: aminodeoxychorismate/anthranilate synthase component II [Flavobacteriales bacterium TMED288]|nr:aminodeoxychorismate/anthranilate synthase component II [Flavobacteriales bacterium]RPG53708.1 MAG: aminodeoxychorismate/anthranilate synthase component II [Flavobacteriales bacterium TMED288]|tara:strand:- start:291 stop:854 length:564 start_codon:yes stop_codon:yes gene_type:complete
MKVLIIDNYDSFTYNLVHLVEKKISDFEVWRNNEIDFNRVDDFDKFLLSPGPGLPNNSGDLMLLINKIYKKKSILGICLGFQALGIFFGGNLYNLKNVKHGIQDNISIIQDNLIYKNIPNKIKVGRYHSWALNIKKNNKFLLPTSFDKKKTVMSFNHKYLPIFGIQYHPESVLSQYGERIINNWLKI